MSIPPAPSLAVVLVEPRHPGNIGMVCRAMANFGVADLRLVNPCHHLHPEAAKFAVFARQRLGRARTYPDLDAALADLHLSIAATRRAGRFRGVPRPSTEIPQMLAGLAPGERAGLVFGREDSGLTTGEVARCTTSAVIPTTAEGSLNLAQAVTVFLYEQARPAQAAAPETEPAGGRPDLSDLEALFARMEAVLERIAFLNPARPEAVLHPLRRIHQRAGLDRDELKLLRGMWEQLAWSIHDWRGPRKGEPQGPKSG